MYWRGKTKNMSKIVLKELKLKEISETYLIKDMTIDQGVNEHAHLHLLLQIEEKQLLNRELACGSPLILTTNRDGGKALFCGIIDKTTSYWSDHVLYGEIEAYSYTILLDRKKRNRSFQQESMSFGELFSYILNSYPESAYIWLEEESQQLTGQFLLQYQETDWEFLKRIASTFHRPLFAEVRMPGVKLHVGTVETGDMIHVRATLTKRYLDFDLNGEAYQIEGGRQNLEFGSIVMYQNKYLIVIKKEIYMYQGECLYRYTLKPETEYELAILENKMMQGLALTGKVIGSKLGQVQLSLDTDAVGLALESWHTQPVYYSGYGGRPEIGDQLQLYFATNSEDKRYIIGSADAGAEKIQNIVNAGQGSKKGSPLEETKILSTPGGLGLALNSEEILLAAKTNSILVNDENIQINSTGNIQITADQIEVTAKEVTLSAQDYIWLHSKDQGVLLIGDQIHMQDIEINVSSPLNEECVMPSSNEIAAALAEYEQKRRAGSEFFEADGSLRRPGGAESEMEKNIKTVWDKIEEDKRLAEHLKKYDVNVEEYHTYYQSEIDYLRRADNVMINATGFIPEVGAYLSVMMQRVNDNNYGNGWFGTLKAAVTGVLVPNGIKLSKVTKAILDPNTSSEIAGNALTLILTGEAALEELDEDLVYVDEFMPYYGSAISTEIIYGEDKYFVKDGDIYIKINLGNGGVNKGTIEIYLSKESEGDPMEVQTIWYYGPKVD